MDVDRLVAALRRHLDGAEADVQDSRALSPGDLHWSMPSWLDRNHLLADIAAKRKILDRFVTADHARAVFTHDYRQALVQVINDLAEIYGLQDTEGDG